MKVTFLIGNGFDKQLGLETGYDQFLKWYLKQPSENDSITDFKRFLANPPSLWWADAEKAMGEYLSEFDPRHLEIYYQHIRDYKIKIIEYLLQQETLCDFSNQKEIGAEFRSFLLNYHKEIILNKVPSKFSMYNETEYSFINFNYTHTLNNLIEAATASREPIYDKSYSNKNYRGVIKHLVSVHGSISSGSKGILMGVNDENQLKIDKSFITQKLMRTLIKPETNKALGRSEAQNARSLIKESDILVVYGWSMGDTDKDWRDLVGEWLLEEDHHIVFFGHEKMENVNPLIPEDRLDYIDEKQTEYLNKLYPDTSALDMDELRDSILIIDKTSYLNPGLISPQQKRIKELEAIIDNSPRIFVQKDEPKNSKDGDIWIQTE